MKVVITSKKPLMAAGIGRLPAGIPIELKDNLAMFFIERGEAVRAETKEAMDRPLVEDGEEQQLSSLPADQASAEETLSESETGVSMSKRGRKKKGL